MIRKGYSCKLFPQYHNLSLDLHYQQARLEHWLRRSILLNQVEPADFAVAFM